MHRNSNRWLQQLSNFANRREKLRRRSNSVLVLLSIEIFVGIDHILIGIMHSFLGLSLTVP